MERFKRFTKQYRTLIIFLLLFPFFKPVVFDYLNPIYENIFNVLRLTNSLIVFSLYVIYKRKPSIFIICLIAIKIWMAFTSYVNHSMSIVKIGYDFVITVGFVSVLDYFSCDYKKLLKALVFNYEWIVYISFLAILLFQPYGYLHSIGIPDGFMGNENRMSIFSSVAVFTSLLYMKHDGNKMRGAMLLAVSLMNELFVGCMTGLMSLFAGFLYYFIPRGKFKHILNYWIILISTSVISVLIAVYRIIERVPILLNFVVNILHKDITFSGRTPLWDKAIELISQKLLLGYGLDTMVEVNPETIYSHCHNQILESLFRGGIPLLCLFTVLLIVMGIELSKRKNHYAVRNVLMAFMIWIFISFIFEAGMNTDFFVPLAIVFFSCKTYKNIPDTTIE